MILGSPKYFATAHPFVTGGVPLLVKSDQFRPIKVDGNPEHPYNRGSSDVFTQATLLDFYDPDRSQQVTYRGESREWAEFPDFAGKGRRDERWHGDLFSKFDNYFADIGAAVERSTDLLPKAKLVQYDPAIAGTASEHGANIRYDLTKADIIVSLDADFLSGAAFPGFHKLLREYAARRKSATLNRLYAIESTPTTTGLKAEHRLGLRASEIPAFTAELGKALGINGVEAPTYYGPTTRRSIWPH